MPIPSVTINELDGSLGVLPPSAGKLFAHVGTSSTGPFNTPAAFGRAEDIVANYGRGPMVESACLDLEANGRPVVVVRTGATIAGDPGTLDTAGYTGTATPTLETDVPDDDYDIVLLFVSGGTIGVAGITYQYSLDAGRTYSPVLALGVATEVVFPGTGTPGVTISFAAGDVEDDDVLTTRTTAPQWNAGELTTALDALKASSLNWGIAHIIGAMDPAGFTAADTAFESMFNMHKHRAFIASARMPDLGESDTTYSAALVAEFSASVSKWGSLCAGSYDSVSAVPREAGVSVSGWQFRRPVGFTFAVAQAGAETEATNVAEVARGPLKKTSIRDVNGNPVHHDAVLNPQLDDAKFVTLRTIEGERGVFITRPWIFSAPGSDFRLMPYRLVLNLTHDVTYSFFVKRLNSPVAVDPETGFILESSARELEESLLVLQQTALSGRASGVTVRINRTDNILATNTITGDVRVIPLGYLEQIEISEGFENPVTAA